MSRNERSRPAIGVAAAALIVLGMTQSVQAAGEQPLTVETGMDLYDLTAGHVQITVPADFFGPGSDPFDEQVQLVGADFGTLGAYELGDTDAYMYRRSVIDMGEAPDIQNVVIQFAGLTAESTAPITVTGGGAPQSWDVEVRIDPDKQLPNGGMTLTRLGEDEGTVGTSAPANIEVVFTNGGDTKTLDLGTVHLHGSAGEWSPAASAPTASFAAEQLRIGLALSMNLASPQLVLNLEPAGPDASAPGPASVSGTAVIDPSAKLGRDCVIMDGVQIGADVVIGPDAIVREDVSIGAGSVVGDGCDIGSDTVIGANVRIDSGSTIEHDVIIDAGAYVGSNVTVGQMTDIHDDAHIGNDCTVGESCVLEDDSWLSDDVTLGDSVSLFVGGSVARGVTVPATTTLSESIVMYRDDLGALGTASEGSLPDDVVVFAGPTLADSWAARAAIAIQATVVPVPPSGLEPADKSKLEDDIGTDIAPPKNGGTGDPYEEGTNDCRHFAKDLYDDLKAAGWKVTFTVIWPLEKTTKDEKAAGKGNWKKKPKEGHCLVDIHLPDGKMLWVEAQWTGATNGANPQDLDRDNDGDVDYEREDRSSEPTEDGTGTGGDGDAMRVEVYDSPEQAEEAYGGGWY